MFTKKTVALSILALVIILGITFTARTETKLPPLSIAVKVTITADEDVKSEIYSYITRELRSLGDVKVVEGENVASVDYIINLICIKTTSGSMKTTTGYALSYEVVQPLKINVSAKDFFEINDKAWRWIVGTTKGAVYLIYDHLGVCPPNLLDSECKQIVIQFDLQIMKNERANYEQIEELKKEYSKKKNSDANSQ